MLRKKGVTLMKCMQADKLSQYVDDLLPQEEIVEIERHIASCAQCKQTVEMFKEEELFMKETLQTPALPDDFADKVIAELEDKELVIVKKKRSIWKRFAVTAAGVVIAVGLGSTFSPAFAQWVGTVFQTERVDEGLRLATEAGFVTRVDQEVTDHGLTLKVEDIVADSSRVALAYQVLDKNGKPKDTYIELADSTNEIYGFRKDGTKIESLGLSWQDGSEYGLVEIGLSEGEPIDELTVKFNIFELAGVKGNWTLDIPINLSDSLKYTKYLALDDAKFSEHGVNIQMKEMRLAPSSHELIYETAFTAEEKKKLEAKSQELKETYGPEINDGWGTRYESELEYHLENEEQKVVHDQDSIVTMRSQGNSLARERSGQDGNNLGHTIWQESFIPKDEKLTFVLDAIVKTEPADFSISFNTDEVRKEPISFEYEGNFLTIKEAKMKKENFFSGDRAFTIELKGGKEEESSYLGAWMLTDEKGNAYMASESGAILNEKDEHGRYKTSSTLRFMIDDVPENVTLHLLTVKRKYDVSEPFKVPLY